MLRLLTLPLSLLCIALYAQQTPDTTLQHLQQIPAQYVSKVQAKAQAVDDALTQKTQKYLDKLSALEARITSKLQKLKPGAAAPLGPSSYDKYLGQFSSSGGVPKTYVGGLDTMKTTPGLFAKAIPS